MSEDSDFIDNRHDIGYEVIHPMSVGSYEILCSERNRRRSTNKNADNKYAWATKYGDIIPVSEMTDKHLENSIRYVEQLRKDGDYFFDCVNPND